MSFLPNHRCNQLKRADVQLPLKKKTPTSRKGFIKREDFNRPLGKENNWSSGKGAQRSKGSLLKSKSIRKSENNYVVNTQNWKDWSAWKECVCEKVLIYRSKTVS